MISTIIIGVILIILYLFIAGAIKNSRCRSERRAKEQKYDPQDPYLVQFPNPQTAPMCDIWDYINGETRLSALKAYRKIAVDKEVPKEIIEKIDSQIDRVISLMI